MEPRTEALFALRGMIHSYCYPREAHVHLETNR